MKLFKCNKCGNIFEALEFNSDNITCCGEKCIELKCNNVDASFEKHVPYVEIDEDEVMVRVGEVSHPMDEDHYIMWIAAVYSDSTVRINLKPNEEPVAYFDYEKGMKIYAYCNLHGLWEKEI